MSVCIIVYYCVQNTQTEISSLSDGSRMMPF